MCDFYAAQPRFAFRVIAQGRLEHLPLGRLEGQPGADIGDAVKKK